MEALQLKREIDSLEFALYDLNLFLDTHHENTAAQNMYKQTYAKYTAAREEYLKMTGCPYPLMQRAHAGSSVWINTPWPWEN